MTGERGSNFMDAEFQRASDHTLTAVELGYADWWRWNVLQPARNALGPLLVTSFARVTKPATGAADTGPHRWGYAVDVVPLNPGVTMRQLADWFARNLLLPPGAKIRAVLFEGDHVHLSSVIVEGAAPGYFDFGKGLTASAPPGGAGTGWRRRASDPLPPELGGPDRFKPAPTPAPGPWTEAPGTPPAPPPDGSLPPVSNTDPPAEGEGDVSIFAMMGGVVLVLAIVLVFLKFRK